MIALLGATGTVGSHIATTLADERTPTRALARDPARLPSGLQAVAADLRDPGSLRRALDGADRLLLLTPHGPDQLTLENAALDAALAAGVQRIVKVSGTAPSIGPNGPTATAVAHWHSEQRIEASGARFVFLRPSSYMQGLLATVAPTVARVGVLVAPVGRAPIAMVDARDVAAAAVAALTSDLPEGAIALTGPRSASYPEIARELGVPYVSIPRRIAARALRRGGADDWEIRHALDTAAFLATGADGTPSDGVLRLTGIPPTDVSDFLAEHAAAFGGTPATRRRGPIGRLLPLVRTN